MSTPFSIQKNRFRSAKINFDRFFLLFFTVCKGIQRLGVREERTYVSTTEYTSVMLHL
jgi:hypothetical protein